MVSFREKKAEKRKKVRLIFWLGYRTSPWIVGFFAMGVFLGLFLIPNAHAEERSGSGTIAIGAVVPFRAEFATAVAENSTLLGESNFGKIGQTQKGSVVVSNGEVILKNQKVLVDLINEKGEVIYSEKVESGSDGKAEWEITLTESMIGKNFVRCRIMTYEQPILLKQSTSLFVWPEISTFQKLLGAGIDFFL